MSEKLSMNNKKRSWINQKEQEEESYPKTINFPARSLCPPPPSPLFPIMHPGGEVNFRKRGSKLSLPLFHCHQTLHVPLKEVKFTNGGAHSPSDIPLPLHTHTHTHAHTHTHTHTHTRMRQTPDTPLSGSQVYIKGYICYHPANNSRSGHKFPKRLWCCVGGGYNKMILFY